MKRFNNTKPARNDDLATLVRLRKEQSAALMLRRFELRQYSDKLRMTTHNALTSPTAFGISFASGLGAGLLAQQKIRKQDDEEKRPMLNNKLLRTMLRVGSMKIGAQIFGF